MSSDPMWRDLAPHIVRQRLIIEGRHEHDITPETLAKFLIDLTDAVGHHRLNDPIVHESKLYGEAAWVHWSKVDWDQSGAHIYEWRDEKFFSVDIYCCLNFDVAAAVEATRRGLRATELVWRDV